MIDLSRPQTAIIATFCATAIIQFFAHWRNARATRVQASEPNTTPGDLMRRFADAVPLKVGAPHPGKPGWVVQKVEVTPRGNPFRDRRRVAEWVATSALIGATGLDAQQYVARGVVSLDGDCQHKGNPRRARFCRECGARLTGRDVAASIPRRSTSCIFE